MSSWKACRNLWSLSWQNIMITRQSLWYRHFSGAMAVSSYLPCSRKEASTTLNQDNKLLWYIIIIQSYSALGMYVSLVITILLLLEMFIARQLQWAKHTSQQLCAKAEINIIMNNKTQFFRVLLTRKIFQRKGCIYISHLYNFMTNLAAEFCVFWSWSSMHWGEPEKRQF